MSGTPRQPLEAAYRATRYTVDTTTGTCVLRVDVHSPALAALLAAQGVSEASYLTASNPGSRRVGVAANAAATARLERRLAVASRSLLRGQAIDPEGLWPPEGSFLALGIPAAVAVALGREFGQNAILLIDREAIPRLRWLRASDLGPEPEA